MKNYKAIDIHHRDLYLKSAYNVFDRSKICKENKELILKFVKHKKTSQHIGLLREAKTVRTLRLLAELWDRPFSELKPKKRDEKGIGESRIKLEGLLDKAYNRDVKIRNQDIRKPSNSTKKDYYIYLKVFYSWLIGKKHPEEFDWIQIPKAPPNKINVRDLLMPEDIRKLSASATNSRDLLIPWLLFELGCRVEELGSLMIRDIEPIYNGEFYQIYINRSKKDRQGQEATRAVIIDDAAPALVDYLNQHPFRNDKESPLLLNFNKNKSPMDYGGIRAVLKKLRSRAGIEKPINPHFFRKSATCYLRHKKKMNDASIKTRHGWKPASSMLNIYASEDQEEANRDYLRVKGKHQEEPIEDKVKPIICKYCGNKTAIGLEYCNVCKRPVNDRE